MGIALFFSFFVISLVSQVILSTQYDHSLVVKEYYEEDLAYQKHYNKLVNNQSLSQNVRIKMNMETQVVQFDFPQQFSQIEGRITFFRPSDQSQDFSLPIQLDQDFRQSANTSHLQSGLWKIKIDWQGNEKAFYKEQILHL